MGKPRGDNFLEGIEYPRPGYALDWEYSPEHYAYRLRLRAPFPHPDDEFAEPKLYTNERRFDALMIDEYLSDPEFRVRCVRDLAHQMEDSIVDQWIFINGRPYRAATTARDQITYRERKLR